MISTIISRLVILVFGTLYPAYASYKAVRTKNVKEYVKWMMYWIVFALFTCAETFTDVFLSWFPFYYEIKIILVLWLLSPATKGSSILYRKFVHPMLSQREQEIDDYIAKAKEQGYHTVLNLGTKGVNYATNVIMQTAIKGGGGIVNQLKKSYSLGDLSGDSDSHPLKHLGGSTVDMVDQVTDPRLRRRRSPHRSVSERTSKVEVFFPEMDVRPGAQLSHVRSTEDVSSGYSSAEPLYSGIGAPKLEPREGLVRTASVGGSTRPRTRTTRATIAKKVTIPEDSETEELFDESENEESEPETVIINKTPESDSDEFMDTIDYPDVKKHSKKHRNLINEKMPVKEVTKKILKIEKEKISENLENKIDKKILQKNLNNLEFDSKPNVQIEIKIEKETHELDVQKEISSKGKEEILIGLISSSENCEEIPKKELASLDYKEEILVEVNSSKPCEEILKKELSSLENKEILVEKTCEEILKKELFSSKSKEELLGEANSSSKTCEDTPKKELSSLENKEILVEENVSSKTCDLIPKNELSSSKGKEEILVEANSFSNTYEEISKSDLSSLENKETLVEASISSKTCEETSTNQISSPENKKILLEENTSCKALEEMPKTEKVIRENKEEILVVANSSSKIYEETEKELSENKDLIEKTLPNEDCEEIFEETVETPQKEDTIQEINLENHETSSEDVFFEPENEFLDEILEKSVEINNQIDEKGTAKIEFRLFDNETDQSVLDELKKSNTSLNNSSISQRGGKYNKHIAPEPPQGTSQIDPESGNQNFLNISYESSPFFKLANEISKSQEKLVNEKLDETKDSQIEENKEVETNQMDTTHPIRATLVLKPGVIKSIPSTSEETKQVFMHKSQKKKAKRSKDKSPISRLMMLPKMLWGTKEQDLSEKRKSVGSLSESEEELEVQNLKRKGFDSD